MDRSRARRRALGLAKYCTVQYVLNRLIEGRLNVARQLPVPFFFFFFFFFLWFWFWASRVLPYQSSAGMSVSVLFKGYSVWR
jgi:hypothetical protein